MNIAQAEIHRSYYRYTVTIDLDQIGIDGQIQIDNKEKKPSRAKANGYYFVPISRYSWAS